MQQVQFGTADMLRIVGMETAEFRVSVDRGDFTSAPPLVKGRRVWKTNDEMVVVAWYHALTIAGLKRNLSGGLARELTKAIARDPAAEAYCVFAWEDRDGHGHLAIGRLPPDEAPDAHVIMTVPLKEWRIKIRAAAEDFLRRKAARRGK